MRAAIIAALQADTELEAIVGGRIIGRLWSSAGITRDDHPGSFTADGDLLTTLVVVMEARTNADARDRQGSHSTPAGYVTARQGFAVWALQQHGYTELRAALHRVRAVLHRRRDLRPLEEPLRGWPDTVWVDTSPETLDPALQVPAMVSRFSATITEEL